MCGILGRTRKDKTMDYVNRGVKKRAKSGWEVTEIYDLQLRSAAFCFLPLNECGIFLQSVCSEVLG